MPQADKQAGAILGTVLGVGLICTAVILSLANEGEQISKHRDANTHVDTTPAYSLIHTDGPGCSAPSAPIDGGMTFAAAPIVPPQDIPCNNDVMSHVPQGSDETYGDAFTPAPNPYAPSAPPAPGPYAPSVPPAFNPSAPMTVDNTPNTIDYKSQCPNQGTTLKIICPSDPRTSRNIQYIRFSDDRTYTLETIGGGIIAPGRSSKMIDAQGNEFGVIKWINP